MKLTHEEKILFPKSKITKKELAAYYAHVFKWMLPLVKDRPISMQRYPRGIQEEGFFQKNLSESAPSYVKRAKVARAGKPPIQMVLCNDKNTLQWLVNECSITLHTWLSRFDLPKIPDRLIFDLDPPSTSKFSLAIQAAKMLREILENKFKLKAFVSTTGSKGLHLVVPIKRKWDFDRTRLFAQKVGHLLVEKDPKKFTMEPRKNKRRGKLYIDTLRNGYAQTVVAPYSVRALEGAPVAVPLFWEELDKKNFHGSYFNIQSVIQRIESGNNPWRGIEKSGRSLPELNFKA